MPGCAMAMARINRPSVFVYGGTIQPEKQKRCCVSLRSGRTACAENSDIELKEVESTAIPGPDPVGACTQRTQWLPP